MRLIDGLNFIARLSQFWCEHWGILGRELFGFWGVLGGTRRICRGKVNTTANHRQRPRLLSFLPSPTFTHRRFLFSLCPILYPDIYPDADLLNLGFLILFETVPCIFIWQFLHRQSLEAISGSNAPISHQPLPSHRQVGAPTKAVLVPYYSTGAACR
mgnify:CR=1 FL=1